MNFIYSFIRKPKHIFLVHGEEESQEILKEKILEETEIDVIIPEYGETYELSETVTMTNKLETETPKSLRQEIILRLEKLRREIEDMEQAVKEDVASKDLKDEDMFRINEKIKDLEKQIINVVEG